MENEKKKKQLKKLIYQLSKMRGRHTELVSIYVPSGYNLNEVKNQISQEAGTASNIKSKTTRKNVVDALEKINQRLKLYNQTPENGLVIFCGNISEKEGVQKIQLWDIDLIDEIKTRIYRCEQRFILEPLKDQIKEKQLYGLISIDTSEAAIGFLRGKTIDIVFKAKSFVPGKEIKGGQSAQRFSRVRDGLILNFKKQIGENANNIFSAEGKNLEGILIGGPGGIKDDFASGDFLSFALKKKIIAIKDSGYAGEYGIKELITASEKDLQNTAIMKEKIIINMFFELLKKNSSLGIYGLNEVKNALLNGSVETLIISDELDENLQDELEKMAENISAKTHIVSTQTQEGAQFYSLGGLGAILRY
ncbi:MAG: peptide chain release factor 1 [Candidatus Aenigmarchaeota archaeon ex4484_52]|nr:MAG: peptide chain release factor 1 [Candidatus Aenigmarchaeota archaeon ex4484_52]